MSSLPRNAGEGLGMGAIPPSVTRYAHDTFPVFAGKREQSKSIITKRARELRTSATAAEKKLWHYLRKKQLGVKFRRQHPIIYFQKQTRHCFITDFACLEKHLIIEIDGNIHTTSYNKKYDANRSIILNQFGFQVIRFSNNAVIFQTKEVISRIKSYLNLDQHAF